MQVHVRNPAMSKNYTKGVYSTCASTCMWNARNMKPDNEELHHVIDGTYICRIQNKGTVCISPGTQCCTSEE